MRRYSPQNGLIRNLADDLSDTWENVDANLTDRIGLLVGRGAIKLDGEDSFELSDGGYIGSIACKNIGPIRFPDGTVHAPEYQSELSCYAAPGNYSVVLYYVLDYSDPGTFQAGSPYPVPASGDNTRAQTRLVMSLVAESSFSGLEPSKSVILYTIEKTSTTFTILEDYRSALGVTLPMTSFPLVPGEIPEAFAATVYGQDSGFPGNGVSLGESKVYDVDSCQVKESMLNVQWKPAYNAWFYEVAVTPYINSAPDPSRAIRKIKIDDGSSGQSVLIPLPSKQKVDISITPFSGSVLRERGVPYLITGFTVGSDRVGASASLIGSVDILNTMPSQFRFNVALAADTNCRIVISITNGIKNYVIYRGRPGSIISNIPIGTWTATVRAYGIDGTLLDSEECEPMTVADTSTDDDTVTQMITLPISCEMNNSLAWARSAAIFYAPMGAARLVSATFASNGSYLYANGSPRQQPIIFRIASISQEAGAPILTIDDTGWPERITRTTSEPASEPVEYHKRFTEDLDMDITPGSLYRINIQTSDPGGTSPSLRLTGTLHLSWTRNMSAEV